MKFGVLIETITTDKDKPKKSTNNCDLLIRIKLTKILPTDQFGFLNSMFPEILIQI